ncbi:DUF2244 domain-containing protein [Celeribacter sp.]|uniref:DUF2244 domain-containing protein n=1 Tax=Celeribacter sp. TaxID=1890673 RepID=UPI003A927A42
MPYLWTPAHTAPMPEVAPPDGAPLLRLEVWPHRSLPSKGFSATILGMFFLGLIPVVPFIGTTAFWILLLCMMGALAALWVALRRSDRDLLHEEVSIWRDRLELTHWSAKGERFDWKTNPYWLRLTLHPKGKVEQYLTLKGGGAGETREVELGSFLSPEERQDLHDELAQVLQRLRETPAPKPPPAP